MRLSAMNVYVEGRRSGYAATLESAGRTMTVGEIIEMLEEYDHNQPVYLSNDGGYTYGNITPSSFFEDEVES